MYSHSRTHVYTHFCENVLPTFVIYTYVCLFLYHTYTNVVCVCFVSMMRTTIERVTLIDRFESRSSSTSCRSFIRLNPAQTVVISENDRRKRVSVVKKKQCENGPRESSGFGDRCGVRDRSRVR